MKERRSATPISKSLRKERRKRTYDDYVSDDSAVVDDFQSDSESEGNTSIASASARKRFKSTDSIKKEPSSNAVNYKHEASESSGSGERLLMRQWLQKQADAQDIPGLCWVDGDKTQIRIPWKHGSRTGWTIEDCYVYQAWAIHTGKIHSITEPKKWKANFRCALNSLPDVRELPHLCQKKGSDPFKVYLMLPEVPRKSMSKKTKRCKSENLELESKSVHGSVPFVTVKNEAKPTECRTISRPTLDNSYQPLPPPPPPQDRNDDRPVISSGRKSNDSTATFRYDDQTLTSIPSLIPTVVEEISEEFKSEGSILAPLHSTYASSSSSSFSSPSSSLPAAESTLSPPPMSSSFSQYADSAYTTDSNAETIIDDFDEIFKDTDFCDNLMSSDSKLESILEMNCELPFEDTQMFGFEIDSETYQQLLIIT